MGNAWERYKNSRAYQENKEERRALSQTLAARDQALRQTGEEVDARIQAQRQGGGFSAGPGGHQTGAAGRGGAGEPGPALPGLYPGGRGGLRG